MRRRYTDMDAIIILLENFRVFMFICIHLYTFIHVLIDSLTA